MNSQYLPDFVDCFVIALSIRYQSLNAYVELFRRLTIPNFLDCLLHEIGRQLRAGDAFPRAIPSLVFLSRLLAAELLSEERLLVFLGKFAMRQQSARLLYCFFAPEISADSSLRIAFAPARKRASQKYDWFDAIGHWLRDIDSIDRSELIAQRTFDENKDLMSHIRRDDVVFVKAQHLSPDEVGPDLFNPCVLLHSKPTLTMHAAAYGALRCFHHFWGFSGKWKEHDVKYATISHFAIAANCLQIVRFLLAHNKTFIGAPQVAAAFHRNHIFRHMVARGAWDIREEDHAGRLSITVAAASNNVDLLGFLIAEGADVNATEGFGFGALHAAAKAGQCQAVEMLLRVEKINPNIADIWGTTPLHMAVDWNRERVVALMLQKKKIDINAKDSSGKTPFYVAARAGRRKIVRLFLERSDVAVNLCNRKGNSPLHAAVKSGKVKVVRLIWECKAVQKEIANTIGKTARQIAVELGNDEIIMLFLEADHNRRVSTLQKWGTIRIRSKLTCIAIIHGRSK
jgi:ankyrin repeat protein